MQFDATNYINTWNNSSVLQGQFPDVNDYVDLFRSSSTPSTSPTSSTSSTPSTSGVGSLMQTKILNTDDSGDQQGNPPGGNTNAGYGYSGVDGFSLGDIGEGTVDKDDYTFGMQVNDAVRGAKTTLSGLPDRVKDYVKSGGLLGLGVKGVGKVFNYGRNVLSQGLQSLRDKQAEEKSLADAMAVAQAEIDRMGYKDYGQGAATGGGGYNDGDGGSYSGASTDDYGGGEKDGGFIDGANRRKDFADGGMTESSGIYGLLRRGIKNIEEDGFTSSSWNKEDRGRKSWDKKDRDREILTDSYIREENPNEVFNMPEYEPNTKNFIMPEVRGMEDPKYSTRQIELANGGRIGYAAGGTSFAQQSNAENIKKRSDQMEQIKRDMEDRIKKGSRTQGLEIGQLEDMYGRPTTEYNIYSPSPEAQSYGAAANMGLRPEQIKAVSYYNTLQNNFGDEGMMLPEAMGGSGLMGGPEPISPNNSFSNPLSVQNFFQTPKEMFALYQEGLRRSMMQGDSEVYFDPDKTYDAGDYQSPKGIYTFRDIDPNVVNRGMMVDGKEYSSEQDAIDSMGVERYNQFMATGGRVSLKNGGLASMFKLK